MGDRQARYTGICPVREGVYAMAFDELLTAIGRGLPKRGSLLDRVRAEARLSIDAYRTAFESSIAFGNRKLTAAVELKGDLEEVMAELDEEIAARAAEVAHLTHVCESLEHRAKKKEEGYAEDDREITELMQEKNQLEDLLKVSRRPSPRRAKVAGRIRPRCNVYAYPQAHETSRLRSLRVRPEYVVLAYATTRPAPRCHP